MGILPEASCPHSRQDKEKGKGPKGVLAKLPLISLNNAVQELLIISGKLEKVVFRVWMHCYHAQNLSSVHEEEGNLCQPQECNSHYNWDLLFFHSWLTLEAQFKLCHFLQAASMNKTDAKFA